MATMSKANLLGLVLLGVFSLSACEAGSEEKPARPTVEELKPVMRGIAGDSTPSVVSCQAEAVHKSSLSDRSLWALVEGDESYKPTKAEAASLADGGDLWVELQSCSLQK